MTRSLRLPTKVYFEVTHSLKMTKKKRNFVSRGRKQRGLGRSEIEKIALKAKWELVLSLSLDLPKAAPV